MNNLVFPKEFTENAKQLLGAEYSAFERAMQEEPLVSVRFNDKINFPVDNFENVKWCPSGFYLHERPQFTFDPLLHAGVYYVQEAASMFLYQAVKQCFSKAKTVLDLCAAPGGKSTLLLQALGEDSLLISNEIIRSRAHILNENITKWGNANVIVTNNKPADFQKFTSFFDVVVVDAPCSGEGMFRKNSEAVSEWSPLAVAQCAERQRNILSDAWNALSPDGTLVYSTCTFNRAENEDNVHWICKNLGAEIVKINISDFPEIVETDGGYRFYPHRTKGEGFFISILRKNNNSGSKIKINLKNKLKKIDLQKYSDIKLKNADYDFFERKNFIKTCKSDNKEEFMFFEENLNCLRAGLKIGQIKGKDFIPQHQLAMSKLFDYQNVNKAEIDYSTAIKYLRCEPIFLENAPRGFVLLVYKGVSLGWVKNIGARCNNFYPHEWRIRTAAPR